MNKYIFTSIIGAVTGTLGAAVLDVSSRAEDACATPGMVEAVYLSQGFILTESYILEGDEANTFIEYADAPVSISPDNMIVAYSIIYNDAPVPAYLVEFYVDGCAVIESVVSMDQFDAMMNKMFPPDREA